MLLYGCERCFACEACPCFPDIALWPPPPSMGEFARLGLREWTGLVAAVVGAVVERPCIRLMYRISERPGLVAWNVRGTMGSSSDESLDEGLAARDTCAE